MNNKNLNFEAANMYAHEIGASIEHNEFLIECRQDFLRLLEDDKDDELPIINTSIEEAKNKFQKLFN